MQQAPADLQIDAGLVVPMTARGTLLEHHSVLVRGGRIIDVLPTAAAAERYAPELRVERPAHVLLPGLINGNAEAAATLLRYRRPTGAADGSAASDQFVRSGVQFAAARLIRAGTTCFADRYFFPDALARAAQEQGLRAHIALPVADVPSPWAKDFSEYLNRALALRDELRDYPLLSTSFAPLALPDAEFARLATMADELEATLVMEVHRSAAEISQSIQSYGERPLARLQRLGVLTPAFIALHMNLLEATDLEMAQAGGIAVTLNPHQSLAGGALPAFGALASAGIPFNLGSGATLLGQDVWGAMRLAALVLGDTHRALAAATCDAAAVLGLGLETGTVSVGKWADLCCVDAGTLPELPPREVLDALVLGAARELVSDVWVAGRPLLTDGIHTRFDWTEMAAKAETWRPKHAGNA